MKIKRYINAGYNAKIKKIHPWFFATFCFKCKKYFKNEDGWSYIVAKFIVEDYETYHTKREVCAECCKNEDEVHEYFLQYDIDYFDRKIPALKFDKLLNRAEMLGIEAYPEDVKEYMEEDDPVFTVINNRIIKILPSEIVKILKDK